MRAKRTLRLRCLQPNHLFFALFAVCLFVFWFTGFRERRHDTDDTDRRRSQDSNQLEKEITQSIPKLMEEAERRFNAKLQRQSKTLESAVIEYRRRYKREPPKDFGKWWEFAKKYNVKMVDEYDILMEDLTPFYELSGEEIRRRVDHVVQLPSIDLVRIRGGNITVENVHQAGFKDSEVSARARGFRSMMGKVAHSLPDMDFPINAKAEGRVLIPWEHQQYRNLTKQDSSGGVEDMLGGKFQHDWGSDGNIWEAWRRTCPPDTPARRLFSGLRNPFVSQSSNYFSKSTTSEGGDYHFAEGTSENFDFCHHPQDHYTQGHFFTDWRSIPVLYPVFSPARAKGFMDIRIPSHYYYGSTKGYTYGWDAETMVLSVVDKMEKPWSEKSSKIFWRGATTGGGSHPPGFSPQYHRHRFLRMASDKSNATRIVTFNHPPNTTQLASAVMSVAQLNEDIMDAAFVKVSGLYPGGLKALKEVHRFADPVPLGHHWSYKYLVDLDGMSYSGRFMSFLASDSLPIKATVYTEFFSDWIEPWLHFVPLSPSYKEIYNLYAYFSGPTQSMLRSINSSLALFSPEERTWPEDQRAQKIAQAGKEWKRTIGRTLDMEAYVYRLCLEWARLWADDRDSMSYEPSNKAL
ncbi:capsular associated protein [Coprinopsis marcescibilis]|uniref:Capsular associated protein n=1 Tax=Coprinopsis marcescibilis TaxID=230819 RepID=A0A5C3LAJ8_COPMA|nr:capsular associated protein [Coprinopsis marcescibilis]